MRSCVSIVALSVSVLVGCSSSGASSPALDVGTDTGADASLEAAPDTNAADVVAADGDASCKLVAAYSSKNTPCNACAESRCCVEVNGCLGDPRCNDDYVNCILACALLPDDAGADADAGTATCVAKCGVDYPVGKAAYDAAIGCVDAKCSVECN
jgi:hypothetical protein